MNNSKDIDVGFKVDLSSLANGMDKAKAKVIDFKTDVKKHAADVSSSFGKMATAANAVKAAFATAAVASVIEISKVSVELATFAQGAKDVHDYFNTSFGSMADTARDWAEALSESYEVYEEDVEQFMGSLNQAFRSSGNSMKSSYEMAKTYTQLSYDLTRYYSDLSLEEIQSALTGLAGGEVSGALKQLKISMTEVELKNKAVAMGIAEQGKELTAAQKQAVAYQVILEQLGDAQGMYGDSAANIGNAMTSLDASVKELKESIGTVLTPVVWAFSKVVKAAVDNITGWLDDLASKVSVFINTFKSGINWVSTGLGFDEVFKSADEATTSTDALDAAMASLEKQAEETYNSLNKLAGFDRMYVLDTSSSSDSVADLKDLSSQDWDLATKQWVELFQTEPDKAVDALDNMWDSILDGSYSSVEDLRRQYGDFFDWIVEAELEGTNVTVEERERILNDFYAEMYSKVVEYKEAEANINAMYDDAINKYREEENEEMVKLMETRRDEYLANLKDEYETTFSDMYAEVLKETNLIDAEMANSMRDAFLDRLNTVQSAYETALAELKGLCDEIDRRISEEQKRLEELKFQNSIAEISKEVANLENSQKKEKEESKGFWKTLGEKTWNQLVNLGKGGIGGLPGFADGGVFEPNNPTAVIVGDNTREREVIAPESMIEEAVVRAMSRTGSSVSEPITIPITLELDGRVLANVTYKYTQQEARRRGV